MEAGVREEWDTTDLERTVHQSHHQFELLVVQDGLVADHVLRELAAERQARRLVLERPQYGREGLARVGDFRLENTADAVPQHLGREEQTVSEATWRPTP